MAIIMDQPPTVKECTCVHTAQDKMYGIAKRVMNWARSANNKHGGWRCTVCDRIHGG